MNIVCPACERISELSDFRLEGDALIVRCVRCNVETRVGMKPERERAAGEASATTTTTTTVSVSTPTEPARVLSLVRGSGGGAASAANVDPLEAPEGFCPKCLAPRPEGTLTCAGCGLVYDNFQEPEVALSPVLAESVRETWRSGWSDDAKQDALVQKALVAGELAKLGRVYRIALARSPLDRAANRGRDEVLRRSMEQVRWEPTPLGPQTASRFKQGLMLFVMAVCLIGTVLLLRKALG